MDEKIKREIILDNYQNPFNRGLLNDENYIKINTTTESCIDNIDLAVKIEGNIIKDIRFDGEACAITTSTTSIMIKTIIDKTVLEALNIIDNYESMINEQEYKEDILKEAYVYNEIYKQPSRKRCALLPWLGIKNILQNYDK